MDQKQNTEIQLEKQYWFLDNWLKVNEGITDKLKRSEILYGFGEFYKKKKEEEQKCWTCDASVATHKTYRDALKEFELTCDKCHREEYPEEYEEEDKQCRDCEIEAKKHCDECGGYGSDDDDDEEEEEEDEEAFWLVIEKLKKEPYYNGDIFESANLSECQPGLSLSRRGVNYYNRHISWGLSMGWIEE